MLQYDPHQHVDSEAWQAFDESERIESVRQYHRQNRIRLANESLHAITHVIIENQVALGDTFAARAVLLRLMAAGLDRHEAIHAIGSVLSEQLFAALRALLGDRCRGRVAPEPQPTQPASPVRQRNHLSLGRAD